LSTRPRTQRGSLRGAAMVRLRVGFLVIAVAMSVFGARLVQLQAIDPGAYAEMAFAEGVQQVVLPAERGAITDRNGYELATSMDGLMVVADPYLTKEYAGPLATFLANRLDVDYFSTLSRLRKSEGSGTRFQYIARRVPASLAQETVDEAAERGWKGLTTERDPIRAYPGEDVAANIVGFIGQNDEAGALAGMERTFEEMLSGEDGMARYQTGAGAKIPLGENTVVDPEDGEDLSLTIDSDTQLFTQRVLGKAVRKARGDSGTAVVMDSRTGDLLSWADYPSFDANRPQDYPEDDLGSRGVQHVFEPGSVEKALTMAALVDQGMSPHTRIQVPSTLSRKGATIHDHFDHGLLRLTLTGVLAKSSNIGTVLAAQKIDSETLHEYLRGFGLGERTDIGARGESRGLLPDGSLWSSLQHDTIAFGQGLGVTAVQMAAAINTIANRGTYVSPSLVQGSATTDSGLQVGTDHKTTRQVVSPEAAREVSMMMERVLDPEDGVAPGARVPGYRVAGKTGTAQVAEGGRYVEGKFDVSFAGFAPADDPRFTVYIVIHNPRNGMGGGYNAGPAFARIMSYLLRHYSVPPTGTEPSDYRAEWGSESGE
jgi:cell division protein FtsI (penicillin-binding protein 3)